MTPSEFAAKWTSSTRTERAASQEHFIDLCRMLGFQTPNEADPSGDWYAFEKGAEQLDGRDGWADVWKRGHFAWEYKGKRKNLGEAYQQLLRYRESLENPPLLVVCDLDRFQIHTNFTNTVKVIHEFNLADLAKSPKEPLRLLRAVMGEPEALRPSGTPHELTEAAARRFAELARQLRAKGHEPHSVAHFLNKLISCMFAEDAGLLPSRLIRRLAENTRHAPEKFRSGLEDLFAKMSHGGGLFGPEEIQRFNGGLFDDATALPLTTDQIAVISDVSGLDWSQIEPAIFGTLFERGLDPGKRSQLGAHYTDRDSIVALVDPVVIAPLRCEFAAMQREVTGILDKLSKDQGARTKQRNRAAAIFRAFLDRLRRVTVLDPACGSGNFLYVALQALKNLEREVILWGSQTLRIAQEFPAIGPQAVRGIEINPYAAELARVAIWIGEIQWMLANGFNYLRSPVLRPLDDIRCADAILDPTTGSEPEWPPSEFIVGNPPFLGGKLIRSSLGDAYVDRLFAVYHGRVAAESDLVCYFFEKARQMLADRATRRVGLLATQAIRGGANRKVLARIKDTGDIFLAWSDRPWVVDGADVHVSLVGFDDGTETSKTRDGLVVDAINPDLTAGLDLTRAPRLLENLGIAFMGDSKGGPFELTPDLARDMLKRKNPHRRPNRDVVVPWLNGTSITRKPKDMWIIDFGTDMSEEAASRYEAPFEYVREHVRPRRVNNRRDAYADRWWIHVEARSGMRRALAGLPRFIGTVRHAKHRIFFWIPAGTLPDSALIVFARADDYTFGVLQSRVHTVWSLAQGTQVRERETGFRYTPTTTFETFPFPRPTDAQRESIAAAARELDAARQAALQPGRALTQLYTENPTWLRRAHERLDSAVITAYGWRHPRGDTQLLADLLAESSRSEHVD